METRIFKTPTELDAATAAGFRFTPDNAPASFVCSHCGEEKPLNMAGTGGTGYGLTADRRKFCCYDCCAVRDREAMIKTGRATLYLTDGCVGNWPGTLKFPVSRIQRGGLIARVRRDAWFTGPDGEPWHGVQYGDNTQIIHCRRVKR